MPRLAGQDPGPGSAPARRAWPREARILKRSEFQQVYSRGRRHSTPLFAAFLLETASPGARVGITAPRALGNAVCRNRIRRRLREAVRLNFDRIGAGWNIVLNPRRAVLEVEFSALEREVSRLFRSLSKSKKESGQAAETPGGAESL